MSRLAPNAQRPRRLLFLLPNLESGGAERVVATVASELAQRGVSVHLGVIDDTGPRRADIAPEVEVHRLGAGRAVTAGPAIVRLTRSVDPDVVWSHLTHLNLAVALVRPVLGRKRRVLATQHSMPSMDHVEIAGRSLGHQALKAYRALDLVAACSPAVRGELIDLCHLKSDKVITVENPVDTERFVPVDELPADRATSPYGSEASDHGADDGPHILGLGTLKTDKAFERLIAAFDLLAHQRSDAQLWIVGEGPERQALETVIARAAHADRIHLPGTTTEPERWMAHADVFASSSRVEAQPLVILEALSARTPVVAFEAPGGIGDVLRDAAGSILVPDGDTAAFAAALDRALGDDFDRPTLPAKHTLDAIVEDYLAVIDA